MPSQSAAANPDDGQVIAPTTPSAEFEVKSLQPINNPQSEPSQTDCGDAYAINDLSEC